jgi:hypothetical protein
MSTVSDTHRKMRVCLADLKAIKQRSGACRSRQDCEREHRTCCDNGSAWEIIADNLGKARWNCGCILSTGRFIVRADEMRTAFLELQAAIHRRFELRWKVVRELHVLLSAQIKIGHATVWRRTRVCVSFILRPSLLPFGFAPSFARILRETFA